MGTLLAMVSLSGFWWYLQQLVVIEMEKEKTVISWGAFGQLLEVRTQVGCPLLVALW